MAVTQVSQIQVRTGLLEDLGNLAGGEFGWAIDAQRLFIGNGNVEDGAPFPGNSEIMTANAMNLIEMFEVYTFRGTAGGYTVLTGPDAANDVYRNLQEKLDDIVNVRDFGAIGNGIIDDTDAIKRCISEIYDRFDGDINFITRRAIHFPAGKYRISEPIVLPPYAVLTGEGMDNVLIYQANLTATCCFETGTSYGLTVDNNNNVGNFSYPSGIILSGMTLSVANELPGLIINSARNCLINNVKFLGARNRPELTATTQSSSVLVGSTSTNTESITFRDCVFTKYSHAVNFSSPVYDINNILFDACTFTELGRGISAPDTDLIYGITVSGCRFEYISEEAIVGGENVAGIQSIANTFIDVGNNYNGDTAPVTNVIVFKADQCNSLGDYFCRTPIYSSAVPRINGNNKNILATTIDEGFRLGAAYYKPGHYFTISNGSTDYGVIGNIFNGIIDYSATRGANISRMGTIKFSTIDSSGLPVVYEEEFSEYGVSMGLTLTLTKLPDGSLILEGTTDNTGDDVNIAFDVKTLINNV